MEIKPGKLSDVFDLQEWKSKVLDRDQYRCINCDSRSHLGACFIIPPEVGGKLRTSNGVSLCRECRIAAEGARILPTRIDNKTPINFFVSQDLHHRIDEFVHGESGFGSISALVRRMIGSFINEPELYEDLALWQDDGSAVKINGWVGGEEYSRFKTLCEDRNLSYTDALKSLLLVALDSGNQKSEVA